MTQTPDERAYHRAYYLAHRDEYIARAKAYYVANRDRIRVQRKTQYDANIVAIRERDRARYAADPSAKLAWARANQQRNRLNRYGLTPEMFDEYLDAQEGACAFCGRELPSDSSRFAVDHDHTTGEVRGLVHKQCNGVIGHAESGDHFIGYMDAQLIGVA